MPLKLNSTGGGSVTLDTPSTAGTYTVTVPATNQTLGITSGTAATASGTAVDFTGIPSWVKRITVMFNGVSGSGTSNFIVRLGTGATPTYATSGYASGAGDATGAGGANTSTSSAGFILFGTQAAADAYSGLMTFSLLGSNTWCASGCINRTNTAPYPSSASGAVTLSGALTAVRITTVNGTDTFDAGTINIMYEG